MVSSDLTRVLMDAHMRTNTSHHKRAYIHTHSNNHRNDNDTSPCFHKEVLVIICQSLGSFLLNGLRSIFWKEYWRFNISYQIPSCPQDLCHGFLAFLQLRSKELGILLNLLSGRRCLHFQWSTELSSQVGAGWSFCFIGLGA